MITTDEVKTAIDVLKVYAAEKDMDIDDALLADLTDAIADAFNGLPDDQRIAAIIQ